MTQSATTALIWLKMVTNSGMLNPNLPMPREDRINVSTPFPLNSILTSLAAQLEEDPETKYPQKSKFMNYFRACILAFGGYYFGYEVGIMNPMALPLGKYVYELNQSE